MASAYLDNLRCQEGDLVWCKANISNPWIKAGKEYIVHRHRNGFCALRDVDGNIYLNPSARFVLSKDALGMQRTVADLT